MNSVPQADRHQLCERFNATRLSHADEKLIHELFEDRVVQAGQSVALVCRDESLTYAALNAKANQLARCLRARGVGPDQLVGICVERSASMVVALLATLKAGGAYVPLDPAYPADRLAHMLEDAAPRVVLTQESLRERLPRSAAALIALDSQASEIAGQDAGNLRAAELGLRADHLAYVIYTSGSTGRPKGVMIEHGAVVNFLRSMQKRPGMSAADRLLAVTTIAFDIAALEIYLPLISGATVVMTAGRAASDAHSLMGLLEAHDISVMQATPATWRLMLHGGWVGRKGLKVLCGGEALSADLARGLSARVASLWNMYGPTETTIWSAAREVITPELIQHAEPIGGPIDDTRIYILDDNLQPAPAGTAGEIYIGGAGVARGYLNRPELTAERFLHDPFSSSPGGRIYRTGDLGQWRQDGTIEFLGRADHQVKLRGYRIELGEIEAQLARHSKVREAVVVAREDASGEKRLVAYLVARDPSAAPTVEELRAHAARSLPEYMVPSTFVALEQLPLTPNGKLDRKALPAPESASRLVGQYHAPEGRAEEALVRIWQELLRVERVGRKDNFFELGGHSLLVLDLRSRIQSELGAEIPLSALIAAPTVELLARLLTDGTPRDPLVLIRAGEGAPPVFLIHDGDGETLLYRNLALRLDPRHAVYGLNPYALPGVPLAHTRIADMAAYHVARIKSVQPHGPYLLGGMCAGGVIAFEMALQLQCEGEQVAVVALLDAADTEAQLKPYNPAKQRLDGLAGELRGTREGVSGMQRAKLIARKLIGKSSSFTTYLVSEGFRHTRDAVRLRLLRACLDRGRRPPALIGRISVTTVYNFAARQYRPRQKLDGRLVLFRATSGVGLDKPFIEYFADPELGWSRRCSGAVRVLDAPGGHTSMLQGPHVSVLAEQLQQAIDSGLADSPPSPSSV